jgi:hypothetical protein
VERDRVEINNRKRGKMRIDEKRKKSTGDGKEESRAEKQ